MWYFWMHDLIHGSWACVGYVHAPHAAALKIAAWDTAQYAGRAVVWVTHYGYGSKVCR